VNFYGEEIMTDRNNMLLKLRARKIAITARGKYRDSAGVLKKSYQTD